MRSECSITMKDEKGRKEACGGQKIVRRELMVYNESGLRWSSLSLSCRSFTPPKWLPNYFAVYNISYNNLRLICLLSLSLSLPLHLFLSFNPARIFLLFLAYKMRVCTLIHWYHVRFIRANCNGRKSAPCTKYMRISSFILSLLCSSSSSSSSSSYSSSAPAAAATREILQNAKTIQTREECQRAIWLGAHTYKAYIGGPQPVGRVRNARALCLSIYPYRNNNI